MAIKGDGNARAKARFPPERKLAYEARFEAKRDPRRTTARVYGRLEERRESIVASFEFVTNEIHKCKLELELWVGR